MANSKAAVLVGTPDVTGSIYTAATTATAPTDATSTLGTGFTACGYVSDGGHVWANWRLYLNTFAPKLFK